MRVCHNAQIERITPATAICDRGAFLKKGLTTQPLFGMDIKGTILGRNPYFDDRYGKVKWEDVADGIIYYKPFYETVLTVGIPGIVSADFEEELMRRSRIYSEAMDITVSTSEEIKPSYDRFDSFPGTYPQEPDSVKAFIRSLIVKYIH